MLSAISSPIEFKMDDKTSSPEPMQHGDPIHDTEHTSISKTNRRISDNINVHAKVVDKKKVTDSNMKSPGLSYIALISMAIQSSECKKMLLSDIYEWISEKFPYYQLKDKSWRNSIRHNLSLNECFVKTGRSENGKGNYWAIHPANINDFSQGDYRRRRARRQVRKCDEDLQRLCTDSSEVVQPIVPVSNIDVSHNGYVPMVTTLVPPDFLSATVLKPALAYNCRDRNQYTQNEDKGHSHILSFNQYYKDIPKSDTHHMTWSGTIAPYYERRIGRDGSSTSVTSFSPTEYTVNAIACNNTENVRQDCVTCYERPCSTPHSFHYGQYCPETCDSPSSCY